jgi:hypothetical protein
MIGTLGIWMGRRDDLLFGVGYLDEPVPISGGENVRCEVVKECRDRWLVQLNDVGTECCGITSSGADIRRLLLLGEEYARGGMICWADATGPGKECCLGLLGLL